MTIIPTLEARRHKKTGEILLFNFAKDRRYGWQVGWGPIIRMTADFARENAMQVILENLKEFGSRDASLGCETGRMSKIQQKVLDRDYSVLGIRQERPTELILLPMLPGDRGGFVGHRSSEIVVVIPCASEIFFTAFMRSFDMVG